MSRIGVTARDILQRGQELGFKTVAAKCTASTLTMLEEPAIIHWRNSHFVVLYSVTEHRGKHTFHIADPSNGLINFDADDFDSNFLYGKPEGICLILHPTQAFFDLPVQQDDYDTVVAKNLFFKFWKYRKHLLTSILLMLLSVGCSWMLPFLYQKIIDSGVMSGNLTVVFNVLFIQLCFFAGYMFSNIFGGYLLSKISFSLSLDYVRELLLKMLALPVKYFDTHLNSEFIQRLDDSTRLRGFLTNNLVDLFLSGVNLIVFGILLIAFSPTSFIIFLIFSFVVILWNHHYLFQRKFIDYSLFAEQAYNKNTLNEMVMGMADIKANNAQEARLETWEITQKKN